MRVIKNAADAAGLHTRYEPDTHSLLLGEFSKADCRCVFPKDYVQGYKSGFEKVSQASAACSLSIEEKQNLIQSPYLIFNAIRCSLMQFDCQTEIF
jgi:hypothetical protein